MATDDCLTHQVPAIRRAQTRTYQAVLSTLDMIRAMYPGAFYASAKPGYHEVRTSDIMKKKRRTYSSLSARTPSGLHLATVGLFADTLGAVHMSAAIRRHSQKESRGAKDLLDEMTRKLNQVGRNLTKTYAPLYGDNDPLSAAWLRSIATAPRFAKTLDRNLRTGLTQAAQGHPVLSGKSGRSNPHSFDANRSGNHGWVVLSLLGSVRPRARERNTLYARLINEVQNQLFAQLSTEHDFDATHLVCSLAAAMKLKTVSRPTVERCIETICGAQRTNGSWAVERPFMTNYRGQTIRPIAAEFMIGAVSVLEDLFRDSTDDPATERLQYRFLEALQRQRDWFNTLVVAPASGATSGQVVAWRSEYVSLPAGQLHTWATARYTTALVRLLDIENGLITRRLIEESGFSAMRSESLPMTFADSKFVDPEYRAGKRPSTGTSPRCFLTLNTRMATADGDIKAAVLHGPPGTSKTTAAQAVAKALGHWFISLSPSDFLIGGPDAIESRAKRIFDYLVELDGVVVLFDEVDRLLLDRDSDTYFSQQDVFKFMTPSMLPKLTALHKATGVKFLIATNYGEVLDSAVIRSERVDILLLVPPPNLAARRKILSQIKPAARRAAFAKATALWVYGELKALTGHENVQKVAEARPVISLLDYERRLKLDFKGIDRVARECLVLAQLMHEAQRPFDAFEREVIELALKVGGKGVRKEFTLIATTIAEAKPAGRRPSPTTGGRLGK